MSFVFNKKLIFSGLIAASSLSAMAFAEQSKSGFTVTPSISQYHFNNDAHIKDSTAYSLGLGYQFNAPWAVEFTYLNADSKKNAHKMNVDEYRLDALYNLENVSTTHLTPYLAAGIGAVDYSKAINTTHTQVNFGGGIKYALAKNLALRGDFRLVEDVNNNHLDNVTSVGVQYTFGGSTHASTMRDTSNDASAYTATATTIATTNQPTNIQSTMTTQPAKTQPAVAPSSINQAQPIKQNTIDNATATRQVQPPAAVSTSKMNAATKVAATKLAVSAMKVNIKFTKNSIAVPQTMYPALNKLATYLQANPNTTVTVKGYTDNIGKPAYNVKLSEKRALAVGAILANTFNIAQNRIATVGYGDAEPVVPNDTPAHREENRHVVAVIVKVTQS